MIHDRFDYATPAEVAAIDDERLRLIFTCWHPALALEARVALTLRMVGGLTVPEISRAFLARETATRAGAANAGHVRPLCSDIGLLPVARLA